MLGRNKNSDPPMPLPPKPSRGMTCGDFPIDVQVGKRISGIRIAPYQTGAMGFCKPALDLSARAEKDPRAARLFLHQPSKVLGGIFLLKPTGGKKIESAAFFRQCAPQVINLEQGGLL